MFLGCQNLLYKKKSANYHRLSTDSLINGIITLIIVNLLKTYPIINPFLPTGQCPQINYFNEMFNWCFIFHVSVFLYVGQESCPGLENKKITWKKPKTYFAQFSKLLAFNPLVPDAHYTVNAKINHFPYKFNHQKLI